jgi:alcohol dehydrogenase class IV
MISLLPNNPYPLSALAGVQKIKKAGLPLFLVPTTAGTGAEITIAAVITDPSTHQKAPVADTKLVPSYIALDADIMLGLPPGITAATGMDALTHAVESWLTRYGTEDADRLAKSATRLVFNYLERAWQDGSDREAREAMAMAAFYAGAAFSQTSVGYVHGIAHQLGRVCGTPHGNANAMVLPEVLSAYGDCVYPKLAELADLVGIEGSSEAARAQAFIQAIHDMRARMEMPLKPKDLRPDQIPDIVKEAVKETGELYPVPRYMADSELSAIVNGLLA